MDDTELPRGPTNVCFDATPLILYVDAGELAYLNTWFDPGSCLTAAVIVRLEIACSIPTHPQNQAILDATWLKSVDVEDEDLKLVAKLRRLWGSSGRKDRGEAEVVALCRRYGWTAIMNDRRGRDAAETYGVAYVSTASMLVGATAANAIAPDAAWELHKRIEGGFQRPMILPTGDEFRSTFTRTVDAVRRWSDENARSWPEPLAMTPPLDKILQRAVESVRPRIRTQ